MTFIKELFLYKLSLFGLHNCWYAKLLTVKNLVISVFLQLNNLSDYAVFIHC